MGKSRLARMNAVVNNPRDVRFADACAIAEWLGFRRAGGKGVHYNYSRTGEPVGLNFSEAKNGVRLTQHDDQWLLELPTGTKLTAPFRFDDDGDPVFSLPKNELLAHVVLRECDRIDIDFRMLPDGGFEIDLGNVVLDRQ
jgi:hypothetical protein